MREFIIYLVLTCTVLPVLAQQTEQYSQYVFNMYAINPAVGGNKSCVDIRAGARQKWFGFADDINSTPRTYFGTFHTRLGRKESLRQSWHAVGLYVMNDEMFMYSQKGFYPSYSYHMRLHRHTYGAAGVFVGFRQQIFNPSGQLRLGTPGDPAAQFGSTFVIPDVTPGIFVYNKKSFAGFSVKQTVWYKMSGIGGTIGSPSKLKPHFYLFAGKRIKSKKYFYMFQPSFMLQYTLLYPPSVDVNLMMFVKNKLGYGVGLRNTDGIIANLQFKIFKDLWLGYSFDFTTSKMGPGTFHTHEIMFSFSPCGGDLEPFKHCPAY